MTGHTKWSELRAARARQDAGFEAGVVAEREAALVELDQEPWEVELQAVGESPAPTTSELRDAILEALSSEHVVATDAEVSVSQRPDGRLLLAVVIGLAMVALATRRWSEARKVADIVRDRLQEWGPVVAETIRTAA